MFAIRYELCRHYYSFAGSLQRIMLHYGQYGKSCVAYLNKATLVMKFLYLTEVHYKILKVEHMLWKSVCVQLY